MLNTYELYNTGVSFKGFRGVNKEINNLYKELHVVSKNVGNIINHLCKVAGIDCEYYHYWMTGNLADFAELVALYLPSEKKEKVISVISECRQLCC